MGNLKIVVVGAEGRMGKEVRLLAEATAAVTVAEGVDARGGWLASIQDVRHKETDAVIDFSSPQLMVEAAHWCAKNKTPLVSGTTGVTAVDIKKLRLAAKRTAILWSPNLSVGVAALKHALAVLGRLKSFDFQIEEAHHKRKKDKPSGTAILLQTELERVIRRKAPAPLSIRGGDIKGIHRVWAMGEGESLCFEHVAQDRNVFAHGALLAARWLQKKKPGLYSMDDLMRSESSQ